MISKSKMTPSPLIPQAELLKNRILSGEPVPLSDMIDFIRQANQTLETQRRTVETPKDADFF